MTIVLGAVAAVELIALLVVLVAVVLRPEKAASVTPATPAASAPAEAGKPAAGREPAAVADLPRGRTAVLVLNGNGASGAASGAADSLRGLAYKVVSVGNASRLDYSRSVVMYRPGYRGEAERLAKDLKLGVRAVGPLDGMKASEAKGAQLVLIVGG
ncbi:MAG: LytR C-terminal domain-containing protein [Thermoleophilia bacterium]